MTTHYDDQARAARQRANALRFLAIHAVHAAKSGRPAMSMGLANIAAVLWRKHLEHNPSDPRRLDCTRFVLF
ncbi:MAG: hypothetical protein NZL99_09495 [Burkholderiaceae bacterium]|nr:hypothetical protein [Burkholderiaceae bacterium]